MGSDIGNTVMSSIIAGLSSLFSQAQTITECQAILASLRFKGFNRRESKIPQAQRDTFEWTFNQPQFTEWASNKDGMFLLTQRRSSQESNC